MVPIAHTTLQVAAVIREISLARNAARCVNPFCSSRCASIASVSIEIGEIKEDRIMNRTKIYSKIFKVNLVDFLQ